MALRMVDIDYHTRIAAPFETTEIFVKGCNVEPKCPGCWNQALWSFDGPAREFEPEELADLLIESVPYKRLTICGGEPMVQAWDLSVMARKLKDHGFFIMCYTGWTWKELLGGKAGDIDPAGVIIFLQYIDVLVDGRYNPGKRNPNIGKDFEWVGSTNQRIIDVRASLDNDKVVTTDTKGVCALAGVPYGATVPRPA